MEVGETFKAGRGDDGNAYGPPVDLADFER